MRRALLACTIALLFAMALPAAAQTAPTHTAEDVTVQSRTFETDGQTNAITVFKPASASTESPVPVILDSHGWGGSRRTSVTDNTVKAFLDAGFGNDTVALTDMDLASLERAIETSLR